MEEKIIRFKLDVGHGTGNVRLEVVEKDGSHYDGGYILEITPEGLLILCEAVTRDIDLQLDAKGRIKIKNVDMRRR